MGWTRRTWPSLDSWTDPATMVTSIEALEHFDGHLFNWYDSSNLAPLHPRYVSSVDSGNLAAMGGVIAPCATKVSNCCKSC